VKKSARHRTFASGIYYFTV